MWEMGQPPHISTYLPHISAFFHIPLTYLHTFPHIMDIFPILRSRGAGLENFELRGRDKERIRDMKQILYTPQNFSKFYSLYKVGDLEIFSKSPSPVAYI